MNFCLYVLLDDISCVKLSIFSSIWIFCSLINIKVAKNAKIWSVLLSFEKTATDYYPIFFYCEINDQTKTVLATAVCPLRTRVCSQFYGFCFFDKKSQYMKIKGWILDNYRGILAITGKLLFKNTLKRSESTTNSHWVYQRLCQHSLDVLISLI